MSFRVRFLAGAVIAVTYVAGTVTLLVALPPTQINAITGIPEALQAIGNRAGLPVFGVLTAALLTAGASGPGRLDIRERPPVPLLLASGTICPNNSRWCIRNAARRVALLAQAAATTVVLLAAISGSAIPKPTCS